MNTEYPILTKEEILDAKFKIYDCAKEAAKKFAPIFAKMDYRWSIGYEYRIPTEEDIELTICSIVKDLYHGKQTSLVATGRIQIRVVKWRLESKPEIRIEMVAESFLL